MCGVTRSAQNHAALKARSIQPLMADIAQRAELDKLPLPFDWVVNTVSSSQGGVEEYKQVYLQGTRNLIDWLAAAPPKKFVYTSSTSVYGQTDGSLVKESSPAEPASETGPGARGRGEIAARRRAREEISRRHPARGGHLRAGPRTLFLQYLKDEARIAGRGGDCST